MRRSVEAVFALLAAVAVSAEKLTYIAPPVGFNTGNTNFASNGISLSGGCSVGEVRNTNGQCAKAQITRNLFLFSAPPPQQIQVGPPPSLPSPKIHYNFVFIRSPAAHGGAKPIVVPPPQQKTLVYVLSKRPSAINQEVIEVGSTPVQPEVFFVNYGPGDNPDLPGGVSLQEALRQSARQGQIIDGGIGRAEGGIDLRSGQENLLGVVGGDDLNLGSNVNVNFGTNNNLNLDTYSSSSSISNSGGGIASNTATTSFIQDSLTNDFLATVDDDALLNRPAPVKISPPASIYSTPDF